MDDIDVAAHDTADECLLDIESILDASGLSNNPELRFEPDRWNLEPETVYKFQVEVRSEVGDPNDPRSR